MKGCVVVTSSSCVSHFHSRKVIAATVDIIVSGIVDDGVVMLFIKVLLLLMKVVRIDNDGGWSRAVYGVGDVLCLILII